MLSENIAFHAYPEKRTLLTFGEEGAYVNILVKTKNAPKALKRKINLKIFCDMGVPILGEGGSAHLGIFPT